MVAVLAIGEDKLVWGQRVDPQLKEILLLHMMPVLQVSHGLLVYRNSSTPGPCLGRLDNLAPTLALGKCLVDTDRIVLKVHVLPFQCQQFATPDAGVSQNPEHDENVEVGRFINAGEELVHLVLGPKVFRLIAGNVFMPW